MPEKQYIGDGVYISNDGFQIILETQRGMHTEMIYLEGSMVFEVLKYGIQVGILNATAFRDACAKESERTTT